MAADNTVNIGLNLDTNAGAVTKEIINLRDLLLNTAAIAARINVGGGAGMPPGAGPDRVRRPPPRDPSGAGGTTGSRVVSEQGRYGALRGVAGETGSAASNFAEQAQGLGGLVRLYATFAANIYAATAAFSALSKAGDLTNLTKGLDQLGASSGKNLGDLAKRLVDITDGGLSATDAMSAVAKASSAGLSTKNIEDLAIVSKKAAQALGLDMSSAFDRLSRGVTKLEPELLDELGLFTKIGPATEEYARKMGKSITTLTDFEKRQAFANAVLKEGIDKFGEIDLISNPYAKLSASLANLTQSGLELVNKVLGPLVAFLSQSPTALLGIIALIGSTFLKSTIPIIGKYRSTMDQMQAESMVKMNTAAAAQLAAAAKNDDRLTMQAQKYYETSRAVTEKGEKVVADAKAKFGAGGSLSTKGGADIGALLKKAPQTLTEAEMSSLAAQRDKLSNSLSGTQRKDAAAYAAHYDQIVAFRKNFDQGMLDAGAKAGKDAMAADSGRFSNYQRLVRDSDKATAQFSKNSILAMNAQANETKGPIAAFRELRQNVRDAQGGNLQVTSMQGVVDKSGKAVLDAAGIQKMEQVTTTVTDKMSKLDAATTLVKGGFSSLTRGISNTLSALGPYAQAVGLAVAAFELLDNWLSAANKDIGLFDSSIAAAKDNIAFLPKTLDALNKQDTSKWMSPESLTARANAMKGISDSVDEAVKKFKEIAVVSNAWDNLLDSFAGLFGKSRLDILSKTLNASILANIKAMPTGNLREEFTNKVKELTGVKEVTKEALSELGTYSIETITALNMAEKSSSLNLSNLASDAGAAKAALEALTKTGQELATSLIPGDPVTKYGLGLIAVGEGLDRTFKTATGGFQELVRVASSASEAKNFGAQGKDLLENVVKLKALRDEYNANDKALRDLTDNQQKFLDARKTARNASYQAREGRAVSVDTSDQRALQVELVEADKKALSEEITSRKNASTRLLADQAVQVAKYSNLGLEAYKKGIELVGKGFELKIAEAAQKLRGAVAGALTNIEGIQLKTEVSLKEADLRIANNNIMIQLIRVQEDVALTGKLQAAQTAENTNAQKISNTQASILAATMADAPAESIKVMEEELQELKKLTPALQQTTKSVIRARSINETGIGFKEYAGLAKSKDSGDRETAALLKTAALSTEAQRTANAQEEYNKKVTRLNGVLEEIKQKYVNINELINYGITFSEHNLKILQQLSSTNDSMSIQNQANLVAEEVEKQKSLQLDVERLKLAEYYTRLKKDATQDQALVAENEQREYEALNKKVKLQNLSNVASKLSRDVADISKQADISAKLFATEKELANKRLDIETSLLDKQQAQLDIRHNILAITDSEYTRASKLIELNKADVALTKEKKSITDAAAEKITAAIAERNKSIRTAEALVAVPSIRNDYNSLDPTAKITEVTPEAQAKINAIIATDKLAAETQLQKVITDTRTFQSAALDEANIKAGTLRDTLTAAWDSKIADSFFTDLNRSIADLGVNLEGAFGAGGAKISKALETGSKVFETYKKKELGTTTKYAAEKAKLDLKYNDDAESYLDEYAALEKRRKLESSANTMDMYAGEAGAMKDMFAEKTAAHKLFAGIEKALHMVSMGMKITSMVMDLTATGASVANSGVRAAADGVAAVVKTIASIPFPFNIAAGAAIAAVIAGLLGGDGPTVSTVGFTAKDQQETQGTGQKWVNGVKTDTGGGVFGDSTAKSNAIEDSLAVIKATSIENMSSSSTMVDLLTSINKNIGAAAIQLFGVKGITGGTGFGTTEGSSGSSFLGGLFGGSQSTEILNSGIKFVGSFTDLMQNVTGAFQQFETVKTTSSSSFLWMKSTSSSISTAYKNLSDVSKKGAQALSDTFNNAGKLFVEQGRKFGITEANIMKSLGDIKMSDEDQASLRGLKGEELSKALNAVISSTIDRTATLLFSNIVNTYRKFGETAEVTVTRVLDGNEKVNLALLSIGKAALNTGEVTTDSSIAISQAMIDAAGDLSTFLDETKFFRDNFVSVTTKINATTTNLTERFTALGFTLPKTRQAFAALVDQFSGTDDAAINLHEKLMKLAPDMDALAQATEATSKLQIDLMEAEGNKSVALAARREIEYAALSDTDAALKRRIDLLNDEKSIQDTRFSQDQKIYALLGTEDDKRTALLATREKELDGLDNQLKAAQRYIYALEDEATARGKASSAINSTITSLKGSVKTLEDYRLTLVTGSSSLATPAQKYAALKQELTATQAAAMGPTDTPAQLAAQQAAAAKLPQVATAFLDQSKIMNASSDVYAQDLTNTQKLISDTIDSISGTQTLAERQLTALGPLANIETASVSTAALMQDFLNASSLVPLARIGAAASGSIAAGGDAILSLPGTTTAPSLAIDRQAIANEALAAQVTETNRLLQLQIDQNRALAVANAALAKRISDDAIKAAKDLADSQAYYSDPNANVVFTGGG